MKKGRILVVRTADLFPEGIWEGFREDSARKYFSIISGKSFFKERSEVEEDDNFQQVIPQIILNVGNKILIHKIPSTGNESRLHDMWPIFLGGHVDETDLNIEAAVRREFEEEIEYNGEIIAQRYVGIVKLHDTNVNKVHVGLVYVFVGDSENYRSRNDDGVTEPKFVGMDELKEYYDKMTYWSKAVYPYLSKFLTLQE
jgi:predicted NUDIX family phosphoesterase